MYKSIKIKLIKKNYTTSIQCKIYTKKKKHDKY